jgi:hypothetical protein
MQQNFGGSTHVGLAPEANYRSLDLCVIMCWGGVYIESCVCVCVCCVYMNVSMHATLYICVCMYLCIVFVCICMYMRGIMCHVYKRLTHTYSDINAIS